MIYKFLAISDIHWGAMDTNILYEDLNLFLEYIKSNKDNIDFIVICGDYFDTRLQLNSKTALTAIKWFDEFMKTCKDNNVKKVRMIKGTREHDNDQLEVFRPNYELNDNYFKLYNTTESELLFPDLRCIFCPDESMNLEEYHQIYSNKFEPSPDIGFFHGNFDVILPSIEYDRIQNNHLPTMIYEYEKFSKIVKGPLIAGHWHDHDKHGSLYYIGSYDRWKFGEDKDKGFIYGEYDTENNNYTIDRIKNTLAREYKTIIATSDEVYSASDFSHIMGNIENLLAENVDMRIKFTYIITKEDTEGLINVDTLQKRFATSNRVKIVIKNLVQKEIKKKKKKNTTLESSKYNYIFDSDSKHIPKIIQKFIKDTKDEDISIDEVNKYILKYL